MKMWRVAMNLWAIVVLICLSGCAEGTVNQRRGDHLSRADIPTVEQTAQQAVDAVFRTIGDDAAFGSFPRIIGRNQGEISDGGPAPGERIPATFETKAKALDGGRFEVQLACQWGQAKEANITFHFEVDATGLVQVQGHTGDWPPPKP